MTLRTHVTLTGACAVSADVQRNFDTGTDEVRLYLGESLVLTMPAHLADAVGDALADTAPVVRRAE